MVYTEKTTPGREGNPGLANWRFHDYRTRREVPRTPRFRALENGTAVSRSTLHRGSEAGSRGRRGPEFLALRLSRWLENTVYSRTVPVPRQRRGGGARARRRPERVFCAPQGGWRVRPIPWAARGLRNRVRQGP